MTRKSLLFGLVVFSLIASCTTITATPVPSPNVQNYLSNTPSATGTATPVLDIVDATLTFIPSATPYKFIFNGNINCHSGPGSGFPTVMTVRGQVIAVLAKDSVSPNWIFVQIEAGQLCWLNNNVLNLPSSIVAILPATDFLTPRPTFTASTPAGTLTPTQSDTNPTNQPKPPSSTPNYLLTSQALTQNAINIQISAAQTQNAINTQISAAQTQNAINTQISAAQTQTAQACLAGPALTASRNGSNVQLTWSEVPGADSYQVTVSVNGGPETSLGTTGNTSMNDSIPNNTSKTYRVSATNSCGRRVESPPVTISR